MLSECLHHVDEHIKLLHLQSFMADTFLRALLAILLTLIWSLLSISSPRSLLHENLTFFKLPLCSITLRKHPTKYVHLPLNPPLVVDSDAF